MKKIDLDVRVLKLTKDYGFNKVIIYYHHADSYIRRQQSENVRYVDLFDVYGRMIDGQVVLCHNEAKISIDVVTNGYKKFEILREWYNANIRDSPERYDVI